MWVIKLNGGNHLKFANGYLEGVALTSSDLSDFDVTNPQLNDFLLWNGTDWANTSVNSDNILANHTGVNYVANNTDTITTHLSAIDNQLALSGSLAHSRKDVNFDASVGFHYSIDTTNGVVVVTLPDLSTVSSGDQVRVFFRVRGGVNDISIVKKPLTADTINGQDTFTLDVQYDTITLVANTTDSLWEVI